MTKAIDGVIVDHADSLHQGVTDDGPNEFKSPLSHILAHGQGFRTRGRYLIQLFPVVLNGAVTHKLPEIAVKAAKFRLDLKESMRIGDESPNFQIVADNSLVL